MSYNQENYRTVTERLRKSRTDAETAAQERRRRLHAEHPEAWEIDRALGQTGMRLFEIACREPSPEKDAELARLRAENLSLQQARRDLLAHLGLPADYTEPRYACAVCRDTGRTETGLCACMKRALAMEGLRTSGLGRLAQTQTFDTFSLDYYHGDDRVSMQRNLEAAQSAAEDFSPERPLFLLLIGPTGLGKTHLSTALACRVIERGYDVCSDSAQNIIGAYEHDHFRAGRGEDEFAADKYETCELLVVDDLGTEFKTPFSLSCLYHLLNTRINQGRSTVINTNLSVADLRARYDDRVTSRLLGEFRPLVFSGVDVRNQKI
ncbi:MAG: ATP-binding protein [Clostridia bacterium]|nr:ATP-binding protein [Clostridia bacterium]